MKDPTTVQTSSRDEMICPACYTEGLEEHKAFSQDYSGKAEILKATRCPNEDCRYHSGFPPETIESQYQDNSMLASLLGVGDSDDSSSDSGINIGSLILNGILILGVLVMAASFLGVDIMGVVGLDSTGSGEIQGQIYTYEGEPAENITVQLDNTSYNTTTNSSGYFVIDNVSYGEYSVVAYPPNSSNNGVVEQPVLVGDSGVGLLNNGSVAATLRDNQVLAMQFVSVQRTTKERTISDEQKLSVPLISPKNLGSDFNITVVPLQDTQATGESSIGTNESTIVVPKGEVRQSTVEVVGEVSTESFNNSYRYDGDSKNVQVYGNQRPSEFIVDIGDEAGTPTYTQRSEVGGGDVMSVDVSGEGTVGPVSITLSGGQTAEPNTIEETYMGSNAPEVTIDSESAPSTATLTLTGAIEERAVEDSGSVSDGSLSHTFQGNIPTRNVVVNFTGGQPVNSMVGENEITATGSGGTETEQYTLTRDADNTEYQLDLDHTIDRSSRLVTAGYSINGERTEIDSGEQTVTINASSGDTIVIWIEARQESVPTASYTHNGAFEVESAEVSETQIRPGDDVGVRATITNPSSSAQSETIPVFRDGEQVQTEQLTLSSGESQQIVFDRISFSEEGVHTIEVSDANPIQIQVGDSSLDYGVGSIYGRLNRLGDGGSISMDTTGDDSYDCQVSANGGSCTINRVDSGQQSFDIRQESVQNTGYTVSYPARFGAKDISVDIDNDGEPDISHAGVLNDGETVSDSVTLSAGTYQVNFSIGNNGAVPYVFEWTEAGTVNQPEVTANGQTVISDSASFKGERTYEIDSLPGGENTLQFTSADGEPYIAEVTWSEQSDETTPKLLIDGQTVCETSDFNADGRCTVPSSQVNSGQVSFEFDGGAQQFDFSVQQTANAIPNEVEATINGRSVQIVESEAISRRTDGQWTAERTLNNIVQSGNNTVKLSTQQVNGMRVTASGTLSYTYDINQAQNPQLVHTTTAGKTRYNISQSSLDSNGYLQSQTTVTIPQEKLASGKNDFTVVSDNDGGVTVQIETINETIANPVVRNNSTEE